MADSIFTKIIKGEVPCHKVYEDDKTFAFLDIHPVQTGHSLVIPKAQVDKFYDLAPEDYTALWETVKKVSKRLEEIIKPPRVGLHVEGFQVPHVHIHLIPIYHGFSDFVPPEKFPEPNHLELAEIAKRLAF